MKINDKYITHLRLTDIIVIMPLEELSAMLNDLNRASQLANIIEKTEVMSNVMIIPVTMTSKTEGNAILDIVDHFIYLEHIVQLDGSNFEKKSANESNPVGKRSANLRGFSRLIFHNVSDIVKNSNKGL